MLSFLLFDLGSSQTLVPVTDQYYSNKAAQKFILHMYLTIDFSHSLEKGTLCKQPTRLYCISVCMNY